MTIFYRIFRHLHTEITDLEKRYLTVSSTSEMELENHDFRAMVYDDMKRGLAFQESYEPLTKAFGYIAPSKSTVGRWFRDFGFGRGHLKDTKNPSRSVSVTTEENAARVRQLIEDDARVTTRDIGHILGIVMSAVNTILHKHLGVHKRCARWVPH